MKTGDVIIVFLLILLSVLSFGIEGSGESIVVSADGKEYVFPADTDRDIAVEGPLGTTRISIRNGEAFITDSPCPNRTCMKKSVGNTVTCLPNRVIIVNPEIKNEEVDGIAY